MSKWKLFKLGLISLFLIWFMLSCTLHAFSQNHKVDQLAHSYGRSKKASILGFSPLITLINYEITVEFENLGKKRINLTGETYLPYLSFGMLNRNGFSYPTSIFSLTTFLGLNYRSFINIPNPRKVKSIANKVLWEHPGIRYRSLLSMVKRIANPGVFIYYQFGTELLVIPKAGVGFLIPLWKNGFIDLGLSFPLLVNASFFLAF